MEPTATEAVATATAATAESVTAAAEAIPTTKPVAAEIAAAHERIETLFAKTVTFVASPTATPSIKTHKAERTFVSPKISIR